MNLHELEINGFGVWNGLKLDQLADGINIIYGPNEAGKSTLLQFVRAMLYGFTPARCKRYLPPINGGEAGGTLEFSSNGDRYRLERRPRWTELRPEAYDDIRLTTESGRPLDSGQLPRLLDSLDESVFQNVFAIGLAEMQELGTLTDTEAARMLYDLTTGLERVSLGEVIRELASSRKRLLPADGRGGELQRLLEERQRLLTEIGQSSGHTRDFARWNREREELETELGQLTTDRTILDRQVRALETAAGLRGRWEERNALTQQFEELSTYPVLPDNAVDRFSKLGDRIAKRKQRIAQIRQKQKALRLEIRGIRVNTLLLEHAPRIAGLTEQHDALAVQDKQVRDLDAEIAELEMQLLEEPVKPPKREPEIRPVVLSQHPALELSALARLKTLAAAIEQARERAEEAKQEALRLQEEPEAEPEVPQQRVVEPEPEPEPEEPEETLETAGELVANLRRRLQVEQRLEGLTRQEVELEARCNELIDNQILPFGVLAGLGTLFIVGAILFLSSLFLPRSVTGTSGIALALVGLGGTALAAIAKHKLEHVAESQLETVEKQIGTLRMQSKQARDERVSLDAILPRGGGPLTVRLQTAERRLAQLEAELPEGSVAASRAQREEREERQERQRREKLEQEKLQAERRPKRRLTSEEREAIRTRAKETHRKLAEVRRDWTAALAEHHLATDISGQAFLDTAHLYIKQAPQPVKEDDTWRRDWDQRRRELQRRLDQRKIDRDHAQRGMRSVHERIHELVSDVGFSLPNVQPAEQLQRLRQHVREQEVIRSRRRRTIAQFRRLDRRRNKTKQELVKLSRKRRRWLRRAKAADEDGFLLAAQRAGEMVRVRLRREVVDRELAAARAGLMSDEELRQWLSADAGRTVEAYWEDASSQLQIVEGRLRTAQSRRDELDISLAGMAADRKPAARQLELASVEQRIREVREQWQVLAATQAILQSVRQNYERDRQPETLQEAAGYLERLTLGRYGRIWTPLDEDALYIDGADGEHYTVDALSRGTREQVFLSLRLALARTYARRGATLPLVLDDVLVNFDDERAKATAGLLVEYAAAGQQTIVFTCHDHIMRLFKAKKASIIRLPARDGRRRKKTEVVDVEAVLAEPVAAEFLALPAPEPAREVVLEPLPVAEVIEPTPEVIIPPAPPPTPRTSAPVIVLPLAEVRHPETVIPSPHFVPKPAEPVWERNPREAPIDPDAELMIDDEWHIPVETPFVYDSREAPADPDGYLMIDDAYLRGLRETEVVAAPRAAEPAPSARRLVRRRWRAAPFTGEGAEEFAGEFAVRPALGEWYESDEEVGSWLAEGGLHRGNGSSHSLPAVSDDSEPVDSDPEDGEQTLLFPHNFDSRDTETPWPYRSRRE